MVEPDFELFDDFLDANPGAKAAYEAYKKLDCFLATNPKAKAEYERRLKAASEGTLLPESTTFAQK